MDGDMTNNISGDNVNTDAGESDSEFKMNILTQVNKLLGVHGMVALGSFLVHNGQIVSGFKGQYAKIFDNPGSTERTVFMTDLDANTIIRQGHSQLCEKKAMGLCELITHKVADLQEKIESDGTRKRLLHSKPIQGNVYFFGNLQVNILVKEIINLIVRRLRENFDCIAVLTATLYFCAKTKKISIDLLSNMLGLRHHRAVQA
ncbi:hypothetical protein ACJX0J_031549 [Zea mays]